MKKWMIGIAALVIVMIVGGIGIFQALSSTRITNKDVEVQESSEKVKEQLQDITKASGVEEVEVDTHIHNEEMYKSQTQPFYVVQYFFASLELQDMNLFMSFFDPELLSKDLFASDEPDKQKLIQSYMEQISRGKQIEKVVFQKEALFTIEKGQTRAYAEVTYRDGKKAEIEFWMKHAPAEGHLSSGEANEGILLIVNTPADIIEQIEKQM